MRRILWTRGYIAIRNLVIIDIMIALCILLIRLGEHMRNPFKRKYRAPVTTPLDKLTEATHTLIAAVNRLGYEGVNVKHTVTHAPRPPAPVPQRLTIIYIMQDGTEWREYAPLNGQAYWEHPWPPYLNTNQHGFPPVKIQFILGYDK